MNLPSTTRLPTALTGRWLITAGHALLPGLGLTDGCQVLVEGDRIVSVHHGHGTEATTVEADVPRVDAPGCTLLPGLIDSHTHLTFTGGLDAVATINAETDLAAVVRALGNSQFALMHGVTTQIDCGSRGSTVTELRNGLATGLAIGPRLLAAGAPITTTGGHCHWLGGRADSRDEVIRQTRTLVADGVDLIKVMLTGGNMTAGSNPQELQFPADVVTAIGREARRMGKPLVVHAHSEAAVAIAATAGARVVAHATCTTDGEIRMSEQTLQTLLAAGSYVDPTLMVGYPQPGQSAHSAKRSMIREAMLPIFQRMHKAGVPLLAGTDGGSTNVGHHHVPGSIASLHEEVGLTVEEALLAATDHPARAFGLRGETGAIEPGLCADLVLVEGDLRNGLSALYQPIAVWARGMLVVPPPSAAAGVGPQDAS